MLAQLTVCIKGWIGCWKDWKYQESDPVSNGCGKRQRDWSTWTADPTSKSYLGGIWKCSDSAKQEFITLCKCLTSINRCAVNHALNRQLLAGKIYQDWIQSWRENSGRSHWLLLAGKISRTPSIWKRKKLSYLLSVARSKARTKG
jgi:hypothetical protein